MSLFRAEASDILGRSRSEGTLCTSGFDSDQLFAVPRGASRAPKRPAFGLQAQIKRLSRTAVFLRNMEFFVNYRCPAAASRVVAADLKVQQRRASYFFLLPLTLQGPHRAHQGTSVTGKGRGLNRVIGSNGTLQNHLPSHPIDPFMVMA